MRLAILAAVFLGCSAGPGAVGGPVTPTPRDDGGIDVTLTTSDGVKLAATHWLGPASSDRCVVLVHQLGSTREEWAPLIAKLRGDYEILAFDVRGHGDSRRGPHGDLSYRDFGPTDWEAAVHDLDAATAWLGERGYRDADCVYVGSSIGSSLVVRFAATHPDAGALVLLSPGLSYKGVTIADAAGHYTHPVLLVYSAEPNMKQTIDKLGAIWGAAAQRDEVGGTTHGVSMITDDPLQLAVVTAFIANAVTSP